jgi:hypothetical protein
VLDFIEETSFVPNVPRFLGYRGKNRKNGASEGKAAQCIRTTSQIPPFIVFACTNGTLGTYQ